VLRYIILGTVGNEIGDAKFYFIFWNQGIEFISVMYVCDVRQSTQKNYMLHSGTQFLHIHIYTCMGLDQIVLILVTRIERRKFGQKDVYDN
jgi:hypothetical protein